jgi:hypothetical protein
MFKKNLNSYCFVASFGLCICIFKKYGIKQKNFFLKLVSIIKQKYLRKTLIPTVLWLLLDFVYVPSKSTVLSRKTFFFN